MTKRFLAAAGLAALIGSGLVAPAFAAGPAQSAMGVVQAAHSDSTVKTGAHDSPRFHHTKHKGDSAAIKAAKPASIRADK